MTENNAAQAAQNALNWASKPGTVENFPATARAHINGLASLLLSALRAPVADERATTGEVCGYTPGMSQVEIRLPPDTKISGWLELGSQVHLSAALASAPVVDERQPDGKRPDLDWIEGVRVTDTVGRGWCVRIDGTDIFEEANRYGCKGRRSFQIAAGLPSKQDAERAAVDWLTRQLAGYPALASAPEADPETAEVDFMVRVFENLDTWRAEEWNELIEWRPAILALLRPLVLASAPVAGEAQPVALVEVSVPHLRSISVKIIPDAPMPNVGDLLYAAPQASEAVPQPLIARALAEWHEDDGPVTWWAWCGHEWAGEAPWCGTPLDQEWPGYHTHWTPIPGVPAALSAQPGAQKQGGSDA